MDRYINGRWLGLEPAEFLGRNPTILKGHTIKSVSACECSFVDIIARAENLSLIVESEPLGKIDA